MKKQNTKNQVIRACVCLERGDSPGAERLARQILAAEPANRSALHILAGIYLSTGRQEQAAKMFRRILKIEPGNADAQFNLASLLHASQQPEESLALLEQLFGTVERSSPGTAEILRRAYPLCEEVQRALAVKNHQAACQAVEVLRKETKALSGHPVIVALDNLTSGVGALTASAHISGQPWHLIRFDRSVPDILQPPILAHELLHIQLEARSLHAGKAKTFHLTDKSLQFVLRFYRPWMNQLRRQGWSGEAVRIAASQSANNLIDTLYNAPLDLIVETQVRQQVPEMYAAQFLAAGKFRAEVSQPSLLLSIEEEMSRRLACIGLALDCVRARQHDRLFGRTTAFASAYDYTEVSPLAAKLWERWEAFVFPPAPADEYRLVDDFAEILGLRQGYEWRTGAATSRRVKPPQPRNTAQPSTNSSPAQQLLPQSKQQGY